MARTRLQKSLADYMVAAIIPALIMVLVMSLVFFLLKVTYSGRLELRFQWILFWFIFAAVLIARIAILEGTGYASLFGFALAGATGLVILRFVDVVFTAFCLLGVIWWCANKLTWDCTLIDDNEDASGEGLLQVARFDQLDERPREDTSQTSGFAWLKHAVFNLQEREDKPHAPGLWVVYFSLAALPLFGIGQLMMPARESVRRSGFQFLWLYVAAALGLLLTTSFLGLRRYLRQRRLQMPATMAGTWLVMGSGLALAVLVFCMILPRPHGDYSLTEAVEWIAEKAQNAVQHAFLRDDSGEGDGRRSGKGENQEAPQDADENHAEQDGGDNGRQGDENRGEGRASEEHQQHSDSGTGDGEPDQQESHSSEGKRGGEGEAEDSSGSQGAQEGEKSTEDGDSANGKDAEKGDGENSAEDHQEKNDDQKPGRDARVPDQQPDEQQSSNNEERTQSRFSVLEWIGRLVKWIIYGLMAVGVLVLIIFNWSRIVEFLNRLIQEFLSLFHVRRRDSDEDSGEEDETPSKPPRPFAQFRNPFSSGKAEKMPLSDLVRYSFEAMEAWAFENGRGRSPEQTPLEFAQSLGCAVEGISKEANETAQLYARLAYAGRTPSRDCLESLRRLWQRMT